MEKEWLLKNGREWEVVCWRPIYCRISSKAITKQAESAKPQEENKPEEIIILPPDSSHTDFVNYINVGCFFSNKHMFALLVVQFWTTSEMEKMYP